LVYYFPRTSERRRAALMTARAGSPRDSRPALLSAKQTVRKQMMEDDLGRGERKQEHRAVGEFAFSADGAAVGQHDVFGDGEAEAGSSGLAGAGFIHAIEAFEEAWKMLGGDTSAEILHTKFDGVGKLAGAENDASAGRAVFQGVVDEVREDLVDGFAVG